MRLEIEIQCVSSRFTTLQFFSLWISSCILHIYCNIWISSSLLKALWEILPSLELWVNRLPHFPVSDGLIIESFNIAWGNLARYI